MADANDSTATQNSETTQTGTAATDAAGAADAGAAGAADAGAADGGAAAGADGAATGAGAAGAAGGDPLDAPGVLDGVEGDGKPAGEGEGEGADGDKGKDGEGGEGEGAAAALTGEVPESYAVTPPEGFTLDPKAMELFDPVFRKLTLTNEGAQELVNAAPAFVSHIRDQVAGGVVADVVAARKAWADEAAADPEIGGAKFDESKALAAKAFDRLGFASDGKFRTFLKESGLGNHPEMIRAMVKMGRAIGEDGFDRGEAGKADVPIWDRVYGAPVATN